MVSKANAAAANLSSTAYNRVTELIRADIVAGVLGPKSRLKVMELSALYGVSPSPVREALQQLQAEGLVVLQPNKGAAVRLIEPRELAHLMHIRAAIEGLQARVFALKATDAQIDQAAEAIRGFAQAAGKGHAEQRQKWNTRLHDLILGIDDNAFALEAVGRVTMVTAAVRRAWPYDAERLSQAVVEHEDLLVAIRNRDPERAEQVAKAHVLFGLEDILKKMGEAGLDCSAASPLVFASTSH